MLPASFGDSLVIEYGKDDDHKYIFIDGGPYYQFDEIVTVLKDKLPEMKEIELLVITHVDIDHIDGIIRMINHDPPLYEIKKVWFNNYEDLGYDEPDDILGGVQGEFLNALLDKRDLVKNPKPITIHRLADELKIEGGMKLTVVNPTQVALSNLVKEWDDHLKKKKLTHTEREIWEALNGDHRYEPLPDLLGGDDEKIEEWAKTDCDEDDSPANRSSIAFIATYDGVSCLMAADATSEYLKDNLEKLNLLDEFGTITVDVWKLSHHGSKKSTQDYLIQAIQTKKVLICSDGKRYRHPDKETIAKLLTHQDEELDIYFNYTSKYNKEWGNMDMGNDYKARFHYPDEEGYMCVDLMED
jgi:beta-lactamase superfamily II metal-dependent hydrolase